MYNNEYYMMLQDCSKLIHLIENGIYGIYDQISIAFFLATGMKFLNEDKRIFIELKPSNVYLIFSNQHEYYVTLTGYENSMQFSSEEIEKDQLLNHPSLISVSEERRTWKPSDYFKAGIYSYGCLLYEIISGKPFVNETQSILHKSDLDTCEVLIKVMEGCLNPDPSKRFTWKDIFEELSRVKPVSPFHLDYSSSKKCIYEYLKKKQIEAEFILENDIDGCRFSQITSEDLLKYANNLNDPEEWVKKVLQAKEQWKIRIESSLNPSRENESESKKIKPKLNDSIVVLPDLQCSLRMNESNYSIRDSLTRSTSSFCSITESLFQEYKED